MPTTIPSTNMGMPIPVVGVELGPAWASDLNASLGIVDTHDHSTGKGTPVITAGININADLGFNSFNALSLRAARFTAQGSPLSLPADKNEIYVAGVDLYYNDGNGNQVRITAGGAISASPGNIAGLVAPASAVYSAGSGKFTWQKNVDIAANMDMGSIIIREQIVSANGITISSPASLVANYTLTLPAALPSSGSQALYVDTSGNMTFVNSGVVVGPGGSYATITAAIAATGAGDYITVLKGTYTENITLSSNRTIVGQGYGTILNGTLTFATGSDESLWRQMKHLDNVTINSGVSEITYIDFWMASGKIITNNGTGSFFQGMQL